MRASIIRHRRDTWLWIILPMVLLTLLIAAAVAVLVVVPRELKEAQTSIVSDLMLAVLILCPVVLCMLPVTILMIAAVVGLNRAHGRAARPLRALEASSETLAVKTHAAANNVNQKTISVSSRFGFIYKLLGTFEEKPNQEDIEPHG